MVIANLLCHFLRALDVSILHSLGSAARQNGERSATAAEVDQIARTVADPQLSDPIKHLHISEHAISKAFDSRRHQDDDFVIFEIV